MDQSSLLILYGQGARVWIPDPVNVWECAEVIQKYDGKSLTVLTESGKTCVLSTTKPEELPPLRNPDILIGENDLTSLSYLHEPAVLYNLLVRFCHKSSIYTYCGIVLVAINPYQELPIYGNDTIWTYRGRAMGELDPHIFAIAEEAYNRMESEKRDQSIIVSGESGAGKTVSAKYVMRYFATVSGSSKETQVEKKVLASSPIMEAIGNAKTTRNDNSSRFGKFIELQFNRNYQIMGASMRTYLLEKSRVVSQAPEERNYHIFYQLCAARNLYPELKLEPAQNYAYLDSEHIIPGVDDEKNFKDTVSALSTLGFSTTDQIEIFQILAGILFLGNIEITEVVRGPHSDVDASFISESDPHLLKMSELLEIDRIELRKWLCHRRIISTKEIFDKPMSASDARGARDALAKHMYASLFSWIVTIVNRALENPADKHRFIGVLDIYGFETFDVNSFEQFCINYANEKLQQQFNLHVFKLDQEEYLKEAIEWKFIDFYDNQPCIDLIETKLGILDLLDEECRMPKGTDDSWCEKLYSKCSKWNHFSKPRFGTSAFIIKHFADLVEYETEGFLDKNKDTVIEEQVAVLKESGIRMLKNLFADEGNRLAVGKHAATIGHSGKTRIALSAAKQMAATSPASKQHKKTVGSQFRDSLNALMATLNATTPHYIRCIKPNDFKVAFEYNSQRAVQQLRACGVLETIRISAAGFPSRILYTDFYNRYKVLCKLNKRKSVIENCETILSAYIMGEDKYKFGKTKIFFRAGQVAFLERLRSDKLKMCCILIQKTVRGYLERKRYRTILEACKLLQRVTRGFIARRRVYHLRREYAAIKIQRNARKMLAFRKYHQIRRTILRIQTRCRGVLARRRFELMKQNHAATIIQRQVRGWLCRINYRRTLSSIVMCQCAVRKHLAIRRFKELKREARSMEHIKKLNIGLENKIISLQQKIGEMQKEQVSLKSIAHDYRDLKLKLEKMKNVESELKATKQRLNQFESESENIRNLMNEKEAMLFDRISEIENYKKRCEELEREKQKFVSEIDQLRAAESENKEDVEGIIRSRIQQERTMLIREQDQDRDAYQKLLAEKNMLEARVESLEKEWSKVDPSIINRGHQRSSSNVSINSMQDNSRGSPDGTASVTHIEREDIGLVLKLQQKLKSLEYERDKLTKKIDSTERFITFSNSKDRAIDTYRLQELEIENEKLHNNLDKLRRSIAQDSLKDEADELINQFQEMELELQRRREECSQLRHVLANHVEGVKNVSQTNYSRDTDLEIMNEDGELVLAFETQKKINRQLEEELQQEKTLWTKEREELKEEIARLREDNMRQQQLLSLNLTKTPQTQVEAYLQSEINRVVAENLELHDKYEMVLHEYRKMKKQLQEEYINNTQNTTASTIDTTLIENIVNSELPTVRKKERDYLGMFEFAKDDIGEILRILVTELKPSIAIQLLPGLPAYVIFMCIRHTDVTNDEEKVRILLGSFIASVKKIVKRRQELEVAVLWLANTVKLMNVLKQYSGEEMFQKDNTPIQNSQCLQCFDLLEYRQVLSDTAVYIYQSTIRAMESRLQDCAIAAILEYEAIPGLGGKNLSRSTSVTTPGTPAMDTPDAMQKLLSDFYHTLVTFGFDQSLIHQCFRQLYYFICATTMNNLLLRKELCHWSKGMQIRYNLSHLEQWARDRFQNQETEILEMLQPIVQAAQLLQARKQDSDVKSICDMCNKMTPNQIIKLLNMYAPGDEYEEKVTMTFIKKVQTKLKERDETEQTTLLMDIKFQFPVRFPFCYSDIRLEDIEIPESLNLPMLRKV